MNTRPIHASVTLNPSIINTKPLPACLFDILDGLAKSLHDTPLNESFISCYQTQLNKAYERFCDQNLGGRYPLIAADIYLSGFEVKAKSEISVKIDPVFKVCGSGAEVYGSLHLNLLGHYRDVLTRPIDSLQLTQK